MTPPLNTTNWNVLYTAPRAEKQVKERIEALGVECFLPLHRTPRVWSDRVKIVEVPLFNSYIFVRCPDDVLRDLLRVYGVVRIVFYNKKPAIVKKIKKNHLLLYLEQLGATVCVKLDEVARVNRLK